jgi:hypothetical protein
LVDIDMIYKKNNDILDLDFWGTHLWKINILL